MERVTVNPPAPPILTVIDVTSALGGTGSGFGIANMGNKH